MRAKVLTVTVLLMLGLLPLVIPGGVAPPPQPGLPELEVSMEEVGEVETDPVEFKHVFSKATVSITNFNLGTTVHVNATTNSIWMVTVSPTTIEVDQGSNEVEETVNVDIRVPPRASAETPVEVTVVANTTYTPLGLEYSDQATINVTVNQYHGVRVSTNGTMTLEQGKNLTHRMRVTNSGNGMDNYTVQLNNEATVTAQGLEMEYADAVYNVGRDRTVSVIIEVSATEDAQVGSVEALFSVTSQGDPTQLSTYRLSVNVRESTDGNGGNGGNGGTGEGSDDDRGMYIAVGIIIVILVLIFAGAVHTSRKADERDAEDEDY